MQKLEMLDIIHYYYYGYLFIKFDYKYDKIKSLLIKSIKINNKLTFIDIFNYDSSGHLNNKKKIILDKELLNFLFDKIDEYINNKNIEIKNLNTNEQEFSKDEKDILYKNYFHPDKNKPNRVFLYKNCYIKKQDGIYIVYFNGTSESMYIEYTPTKLYSLEESIASVLNYEKERLNRTFYGSNSNNRHFWFWQNHLG